MLLTLIAVVELSLAAQPVVVSQRPADMVRLAALGSSIRIEMRYFGSNNFVGRPVAGYLANECWLTRPAATALVRAHQVLQRQGLGIKVFDCYRPQRAVNDFVSWSKQDLLNEKEAGQVVAAVNLEDQLKAKYYPAFTRPQLFKEGYIAERSGHSRGSTVDLTLVHLKDGAEVEMGTTFDFFGPLSHTDNAKVSEVAKTYRLLLRRVMMAEGFKNYAKEWWHYSLVKEPYPNTYFDFDVE